MYGRLVSDICLSDELWRNSLLKDSLSVLNERLVFESIDVTLERLVFRACGTLEGRSDMLIDVPAGYRVLHQCKLFHSQLMHEWQKKPLHAALDVILNEAQDVDVLRVIVSLLVKGSLECTARKSAVFVAVVQATSISVDKGPLMNVIHSFVDEYKANVLDAVVVSQLKPAARKKHFAPVFCCLQACIFV